MLCMRIGDALLRINIFKHKVISASRVISPAGVIYAARVIHCSYQLSAVCNDK